MSTPQAGEELSEERRKEIFRALVEAEDYQEMTRAQARHLVAHRFGIRESRVREIEREGMENFWPPL
jgi:uncharacterized membrane protein